jgi:hypothetical protein
MIMQTSNNHIWSYMKKNQAHDSSLKIGREKKKMAEQELAY